MQIAEHLLRIDYDYSLQKETAVCYFKNYCSCVMSNWILYDGLEESDNEVIATDLIGNCQVSEVSQYTGSSFSLFIDDGSSLGLYWLFIFVDFCFRSVCRIKYRTSRELPRYSSYWTLDCVYLIHVELFFFKGGGWVGRWFMWTRSCRMYVCVHFNF